MSRIIFIVLLLVFVSPGCIIIPTHKSQISLTETNGIKQRIEISKLMLVSSGPVASQVFMDNLSSVMIPVFESKGLKATFSHLGKISPSQYTLDSLANNKFDAYLIFRPTDNSYLDMSKVKQLVIGPGFTGANYGNQYIDTYKVLLYKNSNIMQLVWQGSLDVNFDLTNDNKYKQISKLIFKELAKEVAQLQ